MMLRAVRAVTVVFVALTIVTGVAYPLLVTGVAQLAFRHKAGGSLMVCNGAVIGSELVGRPLDARGYFTGRPSALGHGPSAALSGGSNLGPTSPRLRTLARERGNALRRANRIDSGDLPADLVTSSGSGLDPHLSPEAVRLQVPRVARERGLPPATVERYVAQCTQGPQLWFLGQERVNVLQLNMLLDGLQ